MMIQTKEDSKVYTSLLKLENRVKGVLKIIASLPLSLYMYIFFTFIHFTSRKHWRCVEKDKIYMTNFQHRRIHATQLAKKNQPKTCLDINYFLLILQQLCAFLLCRLNWIDHTHSMRSSMPKSYCRFQLMFQLRSPHL